jgi:hypothetical protein
VTASTRTIPSPARGRPVANPQGVEVTYCEEEERVVLALNDFATGSPATLRCTAAFARQLAYLILLHAAKIEGRLIEFDESSFKVTA